MSKRSVSFFCLCSLTMMTAIAAAQSPTVKARPQVTTARPSQASVARRIVQPSSLVPTRLVMVEEIEVLFRASVSPINPVDQGAKLSAQGASATVTSIGPHGYYTFPATSQNRPTAFAVIELPPNLQGLVFDVFCTQQNGGGRIRIAQVSNAQQWLLGPSYHKSSDPNVVTGALATAASTKKRWLRIFKSESSSDKSSWDLIGCHIKGWRAKKVYKAVNPGDKA